MRPLSGTAGEAALRARSTLIDRVADLDSDLADQFLAEETVSPRDLWQAIRRVTLARRAVPVIGGSAYRHVGIQPLLDAVVDYLPDPMESAPIEGVRPDDDTKVLVDRRDPSTRALVFKIDSDPHAGQLAYVRVFSGRIHKGDTLFVPRTGKRVRIGRLLRMQGSRRESVDVARAGEIVAVIGLNQAGTGDTLCCESDPIHLERPVFPEPVVSIAIEPERSEDRKDLGVALQKMVLEDPTLRVTQDGDTGQTLLAGMGELHLAVRLDTLRDQHGVGTLAGPPRIAYRETIRAKGSANYLLKKQVGGSGMFARVVLEVEPGEAGSGITIDDRIVGGAIPKVFLSACYRGIRNAVGRGVLAEYPVTDVRVLIVDGEVHSNDSNDLAFQQAAEGAMREALAAASPVLLEPIMRVVCELPDAYHGSVLGDLTRRRAIVKAVESSGAATVLRAEVPLVEMFRYATDLRTLTRGRGSYSMLPCRFEAVPAALAQVVVRGG